MQSFLPRTYMSVIRHDYQRNRHKDEEKEHRLMLVSLGVSFVFLVSVSLVSMSYYTWYRLVELSALTEINIQRTAVYVFLIKEKCVSHSLLGYKP